MRRCASNFCQDLREASELTTNALRVASALDVYSAHTESTCYNNPTNAQHIASAQNEWCALGVRYVCARCSLGVR